ncbi:MAG TPA: nucleotidyltransferase domain-containing protein [Prolixibacteraceae bacterium]|nr:nucleotidyltransferase domain-containing protein [Prolixibacteraceae bacterium]
MYKQEISIDALEIISEITEIFKQQGVERVILFGSYAYGNPSSESDIDLMVVVPQDSIPSSHREKMDLYLYYNQFIKNYRKIIPIDLIVYTKATYQKFVEMNSMFSKEIINEGLVLYEANNKGVS